ncbi:MAG: DUF5786 family protein [Halobacteriales archaeon]
MSMGAYDEDEHERRERKASAVDASFDDERHEYDGSVVFEDDEDADELLARFEEIKD